ncbi:hypothetical protein [Aliidongia dinghuensis]|nr:hypothetical protein [Aliidongia dinghuensis]
MLSMLSERPAPTATARGRDMALVPEAQTLVSSAWLESLAALLTRQVEDSEYERITIDTKRLGELWSVATQEAERLICEAARIGGLAVGIVDSTCLDVMSVEVALTILEE